MRKQKQPDNSLVKFRVWELKDSTLSSLGFFDIHAQMFPPLGGFFNLNQKKKYRVFEIHINTDKTLCDREIFCRELEQK